MSVCWHDGLGDDWDDAPDSPPGADVVLDDDRDLVDERLARGLVIRARSESSVWIRADFDVVRSLDESR